MDRRTALLSAAHRHLRDAAHLLDTGNHQSVDQAFHLTGYAPECARKATLAADDYDKAIGHGGSTGDIAMHIALHLDPAALRYDTADWTSRFPHLTRWSEGARYEPTGTRKTSEATTLLMECTILVDSITAALWADGRIATELPA